MGIKRILTLKQLRKKLAEFGVSEDPSGGKGSHTVFWKTFSDGTYTYPVPTTRKDVLPCYVKGCRRRFKLMPEDGISDEEFFDG